MTSPTRRPLKETLEPWERPETDPENTMRTALARLTPLAAGEPVDEAEGRRDHRQGEEPDQGVICTRFHRYPYAPPAMTARARFP